MYGYKPVLPTPWGPRTRREQASFSVAGLGGDGTDVANGVIKSTGTDNPLVCNFILEGFRFNNFFAKTDIPKHFGYVHEDVYCKKSVSYL